MKRETVPSSLPKKKRTPATPKAEVPMATVMEKKLSAVVTETYSPEVVAILDFLHFYVSAI